MEVSQEVRTRERHKARTKGRKQQRARAPLRQPGATHQMGARQILHSAWFSKLTTCLGIYHNACLKHSTFLNRNTVCLIVAHMEHHGNSMGTGDRRKKKKQIRHNKLEQGSKHGNLNMPPRLIGGDLALRPALQISGLHCTHGICLIPPRLQIYKLKKMEHAQTRRLLH